MDIIFVRLPNYLIPICWILKKLGNRVFYIKLSGDEKTRSITAEKLKNNDILPLPLEDIPHFKGFSEIFFDPEMITFRRANDIAPLEFLQVFGKIFPNVKNFPKKMQAIVQSEVDIQLQYITGKANIWAESNPQINHLLVNTSPRGFLLPELSQNVRLLVIPLEPIEVCVSKLFNAFNIFYHGSLRNRRAGKTALVSPQKNQSEDITKSRVTYVTHQGLCYGNLYQKNIFYSAKTGSELNPAKLLFIDYSGIPAPSEKIKWVCLGDHRQSWPLIAYRAVVALGSGILHIRRLRHFLGIFIVMRYYIVFRSFSTQLKAFPNLKIALIDYDILCPKELLLAFESGGIRTVATQERFLVAFEKAAAAIYVNDYLCASRYAADEMEKSPSNCVDNYLPVGQYRSDYLLQFKNLPPPKILKGPIEKGLRIVTALGFHTQMEWYTSRSHPLINWKAHQHFLEDMIRLSHDIPDVYIILRYKDIDWMKLPVFTEIIRKIGTSENIIISTEYDTYNFSYDLCAHSDLVIAKHTSLADECLSVGIPVLFHEYIHNTERIMADAFDYRPTDVMCYNYEELLKRTKVVLSGAPNAMIQDYEYLKNVVYGGMGDGKVKERIHHHIEKLISDL